MSKHKHYDTGASQPGSELEQLRARVAYLEARLVKVSEEGAAMAAQNQVLRDIAEILLCIDQCEKCRDEGSFHRAAVKVRLAETPKVSLARLRDVIEGEVMTRIQSGLSTNATRDDVIEWLSQESLSRQAPESRS